MKNLLLMLILCSCSSFSQNEQRWKEFITESEKDFPSYIKRVELHFGRSLNKPYHLKFITGGKRDAFTEGENTIVLDLGQWSKNYSFEEKDKGRVLRILSHEYAHLLTKKEFQIKEECSLKEKIHFNLFYEGIGHYFSLSRKWKDNGRLSRFANNKLSYLEPILKRKLLLLNEGIAEPKDFVGMNIGPFQEKWGALTIALWLVDETKGDHQRFQILISKGPKLIEELARKRLKI